MKFVCHAEQKAHYPKHFLVNGVFQPNPEVPERFDILRDAALRARCEEITTRPQGMDAIARVHTGAYLGFLEHAHRRWSYIEEASPAVVPNIHPDRRDVGYPRSVVAQAGYHMSDAGAPVGPATWESACWSAWTAIQATNLLLDGESGAYALCRPPGHHAFSDMAGGFCYFNNTAIAAERLRSRHERVAILDVDLHHGNGTQAIFYQRADVLTVSIHADPVRFYPFFWGYADEEGDGEGRGYNLNLPLERGAGDEAFLDALDRGLERVNEFAPGALVVALGLDASEADPFGGLAVTTGGFGEIAQRIGSTVKAPTLLVQEGGYVCEPLGDNLVAFLEAWAAGGNS